MAELRITVFIWLEFFFPMEQPASSSSVVSGERESRKENMREEWRRRRWGIVIHPWKNSKKKKKKKDNTRSLAAAAAGLGVKYHSTRRSIQYALGMNCVYVCSCSSQPQIGLWWHDDKTREKISKGTFLFFFCPVTENKELLLLFSSVSRYRFPLQLLEEENIVQARSCWPLSLVNLSRPVVLVVARWLNAAGPRTDPVFVRPIGRPKSYARWRVGGMGPRALGVEWLWISCFVIQVSRSRLNVPVHLLFFFFPIFIFIFFFVYETGSSKPANWAGSTSRPLSRGRTGQSIVLHS